MKNTSSTRAERRKLERNIKEGKPLGKASLRTLLFKAKYQLSDKGTEQLLKLLSAKHLNYIEGCPLPKNYVELRNTGQSDIGRSLKKEIIWYSRLLKKYAPHINKFISLEEKFENEFLLGNYKNANNILGNIEEICVSEWLIEKKLLLAEYEFGFNRNKEILSEVINEANDGITNLLATSYSIRAEKNTSPGNYNRMILNYTGKFDEEPKEFLNYKLNYYSKFGYSYNNSILFIDNNTSIIDRYKTFQNILMLQIAGNVVNEIDFDFIKTIIRELADVIQDSRWVNMLLLMGESVESILTKSNIEYVEILDLHISGNDIEVVKRAKEFLKNNPLYFEVYELYVKACVSIGASIENVYKPNTLAHNAIEDVKNIILKNDQTQNSIIDSYKSYCSFGNSQWSSSYFAFINREHGITNSDPDYGKIAFMNSRHISPIMANLLESKHQRKEFLNKFLVANPASIIVRFMDTICKYSFMESEDYGNYHCNDVHPFHLNLSLAIIQSNIQKNDLALLNFTELLNENLYEEHLKVTHNYEDVINGYIQCNIRLGNIKKAIDSIIKSVIKNPNLNKKLNYPQLINIYLDYYNSESIYNISIPILFQIYSTNANDIWISYDNFMCQHKINYPHELASVKDQFAKEELIYFLNNICRQEIYSSNPIFETQDDLDNERIEICLLLAELDQEYSTEYFKEITEISRNILIRKGIKQIDESKIYVDVAGLKASIEKDLQENFIRSLNLVNVPIQQLNKIDKISSLNEDLMVLYDKNAQTTSEEFNKDNIVIVSFSRFKIFVEMFYKVRDKFISSNEYGIETYLSMRIRHGTLLGEIRSVFEGHKLITKNDSDSNEYQNNTYWLTRLAISEKVKITKFNSIANTFSKKVDDLGDLIKNNWLQIKTEKKVTDGLFDYTYSSNDILLMFQYKYSKIDNYDEFFDTLIDDFWGRTETNLSNIRHFISVVAKNQAIQLLTQLQIDIETLLGKSESVELARSIITCQTSIAIEFDKIAQWFQRTNSKTINDFSIQLPIDASLTTIRRIYPNYANFNPVLTNTSSTLFDGAYFIQCTDLFQILFENIIKHSQIESDKLAVEIDIREKDKELFILVKNNVSNEADIQKLNQRIQEAKKLLSESLDTERTRNEGRSGYLKIKKILKIDLFRSNFEISFSEITDERIFLTNISFPINNLQKIEQ